MFDDSEPLHSPPYVSVPWVPMILNMRAKNVEGYPGMAKMIIRIYKSS